MFAEWRHCSARASTFALCRRCASSYPAIIAFANHVTIVPSSVGIPGCSCMVFIQSLAQILASIVNGTRLPPSPNQALEPTPGMPSSCAVKFGSFIGLLSVVAQLGRSAKETGAWASNPWVVLQCPNRAPHRIRPGPAHLPLLWWHSFQSPVSFARILRLAAAVARTCRKARNKTLKPRPHRFTRKSRR